MQGWARRDGSPHDGWVIDDGALFRKSGGGDLYYRFPVRDFELSFKWRISSGGNSGLKYRVQSYGNQWLGCEYQILDDAAHRDANKSAGLYDIFDPPECKPLAKPNVWNQSRIVVCGNHIEHWLNGIQTVCADGRQPTMARGRLPQQVFRAGRIWRKSRGADIFAGPRRRRLVS